MTTIDIYMCLRNNRDTLENTFRTLETIEEMHVLRYFIYENDSTDDTPSMISEFMRNRPGAYKCETLRRKQWGSVSDSNRSADMATYRNKMRALCEGKRSEYSVIVDSEVAFSLDTINQYLVILKDVPGASMVTPFGESRLGHYYDTYALVTPNGKTRLPPVLPRLYWVHSAFGGVAMLRSAAFEHCYWGVTNSCVCSEHVEFCRQVRNHGQVILARDIRVTWGA